VDKEQYYKWLKFGDIKRETGSITVTAQDQALSTNYFNETILKEGTENKCRPYQEYEDTTDHLTSGCPILASSECIVRHDEVCTHLHYSIYKK
jgi:hypothetical protein